MLGIVLGLGASLCWGVSDFLGGLESRRAPQIGVMVVGACVGCAVLIVAVALGGGPRPALGSLLVGAASGVSVTVALLAFYRALAIGVMSVVAPIAATGVIVPVVVGVAGGERPGPVRVLGVAVALAGIVLVSRQEERGSRSASSLTLSVVLAIISALCFGGQFVGLRAAARGDPLWGALASVGTYTALMVLSTLGAWMRGRTVRPGRAVLPWLVALGLCFGAANALFAAATRHGDLSAVAVAASLYPVVTVLLARFTLAERLRPVQQAGAAAALTGVVLIALGAG